MKKLGILAVVLVLVVAVWAQQGFQATFFAFPEIANPGAAQANFDVCYADNGTHNIRCSMNNGTIAPLSQTFGSGSSVALGTGAIGSNACATTVTVAFAGVATTDTVAWSFNADPNAVTGYGAGATGSLSVWAFPTSGNVNFRVCNLTAGSITPGAISINWRVVR